MNTQNIKWINSKSPAGRVRTFERIAIFALNNAIAEGLAFTALDGLGIKGNRITHNCK